MELLRQSIQQLQKEVEIIAESPIPHAIEDELGQALKLLSKCESNNNLLAINNREITGIPSRGKYQYQDTTWKTYLLKYGLIETGKLTDKEFILLMNNESLQDKLTRTIFEREPEAWRHWKNCARKHGLDKLNFAAPKDFARGILEK